MNKCELYSLGIYEPAPSLPIYKMGAKFLGDIYPQCVIDSFAHAATRGRDS